MKKLYDVYFTLDCAANAIVEAKNKDEAVEVVINMSNEELLERFADALDMGLDIVGIVEMEE